MMMIYNQNKHYKCINIFLIYIIICKTVYFISNTSSDNILYIYKLIILKDDIKSVL